MKAKALFVIIVSVFFVCKAGNAQEAWEMINDFEGEGLKKGGVFTLPALEDQSGNIWFVTNSGNVYKRENNTSVLTMDLGCQTPLKQKKFNTEDCYKLFKDSRGNLWLTTTNSGISQYVNDRWLNLTEEAGLPSKEVICSYEDSKGNIWFGTKEGVAKFDGREWTIYSEPEGLTVKDVLQIIEDKNGKVWFKCKNDGILIFDGDAWEKISDSTLGLASGNFREIYVAANGNVWVTSAANVSVYDGQEWMTFGNTLDKVELEEFKEVIGGTYYKLDKPIIIEEDSKNNIWIAHKKGISRYDGRVWTSYTSKDGLLDKWQLNWLVVDDDDIYTGPIKNDGVLYKFNGTTWEHLALKGEKFIVSLHIDKRENLWISGAKGLHKIEKGQTESKIVQKPDFGYMFNGIYEADNGVLWFGLQGFKSRVLKYNPPN